MGTTCTCSRDQLASALQKYLTSHPEVSSVREMARHIGISYDALRKYVSGSNIPPPDKWALLQPLLAPYLSRNAINAEELFGNGEEMRNMEQHDERATLGREHDEVVRKLLDEPATQPDPTPPIETTAEQRQELFIPIHGFVWFYPEEIEIIDHPAFQRLSGLHQLGMAYLVFRGATHRRFEHVLGTVGVAQRMLEAVAHNCRKVQRADKETEWLIGAEPTKWEQRFVRLAALLHDIGHLPFGHTFEDELHLLGKHDEGARLSLVFNKTEWYGSAYPESLATRINRLYNKYLPDSVRGSYEAADVVAKIILKPLSGEVVDSRGSTDDNLLTAIKEQNTAEDKLARSGLRIGVCRDIVGNTICADNLDYLYRDWFHVGKPGYFDERILQYMEIRTQRANQTSPGIRKEPTPNDAFVISLGRSPKLRTDGVSEIMALLENRYQLSEAVLFHRTKMKATAMLERSLSLAIPPNRDTNTPVSSQGLDAATSLEGWLLEHPEESLLPAIIESTGIFSSSGLSPTRKAELGYASVVARKLLRRDLYDELWVRTYDELNPKVDAIQKKFGNDEDAPQNRADALSLLERDFGLERGSIAMYCPESRMNSKVARVRILVEDTVELFEKYEIQHNNRLSGGHLKAQLTRFQQLWRIAFFVDPDVKRRIADFLPELREAIAVLVLGQCPDGNGQDEWTQRLAQRLVRIPSFHLHGRSPLDSPSPLTVARQDGVNGQYPMGAPSLLRFFDDGIPSKST